MKLKDIQVGQEYAWRPEPWPGGESSIYANRVVVQEIGVHGSVFDGWSHRKSDKANYIKVMFLDDQPPQIRCVPARQIAMTWPEWLEVDKARRDRASVEHNARVARERRVVAAIESINTAIGGSLSRSGEEARVSLKDLEAIASKLTEVQP